MEIGNEPIPEEFMQGLKDYGEKAMFNQDEMIGLYAGAKYMYNLQQILIGFLRQERDQIIKSHQN